MCGVTLTTAGRGTHVVWLSPLNSTICVGVTVVVWGDCHNSWKGDSCGMAVTFKLDFSCVWVTVVVWGDCHNSWKGDLCGMAVTFKLD